MSKTNLKSALVSIVLAVVLALSAYIIGIGDIFALQLKPLLNIGVMALLTGVVSFIKSLGTDTQGKFAGIKVK